MSSRLEGTSSRAQGVGRHPSWGSRRPEFQARAARQKGDLPEGIKKGLPEEGHLSRALKDE